MDLGWLTATPQADALCDDVLSRVLYHWTASATPKDPDRQPKKARQVIAGFLGAFLIALDTKPPRDLYRSWMDATFSKTADTAVRGIGAKAARAVRDALVALGFLEVVTGHRFRERAAVVEGLEEPVSLPDQATTHRVSASLVALAASHGVSDRSHFRPTMPVCLVQLRRQRKQGTKRKPDRTIELPKVIRESPLVAPLATELDRINTFLDSFRLTTVDRVPAFFGLTRVFSVPWNYPEADLAAYPWNLHGRLYCRGYGSYMGVKKRARRQLVIDGEVVSEIDIRASWPTAVYGLTREGNAAFDPDYWNDEDRDPYDMILDPETGQKIPRDIVKAASSVLLANRGVTLRRWPEETVESLLGDYPGLLAEYPAQRVGNGILLAHPHIARWKEAGGSCMTLMFLESQVIFGVIRRAMPDGVPAYPIHDGLLVPESWAEAGREVVREEFFKVFGCRPYVASKGSDIALGW
ncbi:PIN domain-containing protein [Geminicoccus harenae]|uniref:hypothetical protein n=1 Tax=Geminicoccus harenae TaxID=2498453 RepID=UPI00168ABD10|nr:hypothetical protein [Geminicoccus harenae]